MISPNIYLGPPVKMPSRRTLTVIALVTVSVLVLLYTSRRIGSWPALDDPYTYRDPHDPHKSHHAGQGSPDPGHPDHVPPPPPPPPPVDPVCEGFPDTSKVLLVMKTGASEAFARVPTQLMTMMKCLPDFLIFSDLDQNLAGQEIHDSLSTVVPEAQDGNGDFDLYRRQKSCLVDQASCNKRGDPSSEGWKLDKYKNIHIAERAYAMRPDYDWYLFVDADTYVLWPNLMEWLKRLNAKKKLYLGSVTMIHGFRFGHGGSGYLVSKGAMKDFVGKHPGVANEFDVRASKECCGDYIFAMALKNKTQVAVQQMVSWPRLPSRSPRPAHRPEGC